MNRHFQEELFSGKLLGFSNTTIINTLNNNEQYSFKEEALKKYNQKSWEIEYNYYICNKQWYTPTLND